MLFRSNDTATTEIYTQRYTLSLHDALPFCLSPREQVLEFGRGNSAREVLAVYEPLLKVDAPVHVSPHQLARDVAPAVGRTRALPGALPPVDVDELHRVEQIDGELLELRVIEPFEV